MYSPEQSIEPVFQLLQEGYIYVSIPLLKSTRETKCLDFSKNLSRNCLFWCIVEEYFGKYAFAFSLNADQVFRSPNDQHESVNQDVIGWIENVCIIKKHCLNYHGAMTIKRKKATKSFFWRKKIVPKLGKWDIFYPKPTLINFPLNVFIFVKLHLMVDIRKWAKETGLDF